jgi:hypothetical protein
MAEHDVIVPAQAVFSSAFVFTGLWQSACACSLFRPLEDTHTHFQSQQTRNVPERYRQVVVLGKPPRDRSGTQHLGVSVGASCWRFIARSILEHKMRANNVIILVVIIIVVVVDFVIFFIFTKLLW